MHKKSVNATLPFIKNSLVFKGTTKNCSVQLYYVLESGILSTGFLFDRLLFVKDQGNRK
ncbi:unnamed protein product [Ixodes persulcatus]